MSRIISVVLKYTCNFMDISFSCFTASSKCALIKYAINISLYDTADKFIFYHSNLYRNKSIVMHVEFLNV